MNFMKHFLIRDSLPKKLPAITKNIKRITDKNNILHLSYAANLQLNAVNEYNTEYLDALCFGQHYGPHIVDQCLIYTAAKLIKLTEFIKHRLLVCLADQM